MKNIINWIKQLDRRWLIGGAAAIAAVVVLIVLVLLSGKAPAGTPASDASSAPATTTKLSPDDPYAIDRFHKGYYYVGESVPELKSSQITSTVNEMYYTNAGHLCLKMTLGNGSANAVRLTSLNVKVVNGYNNTIIAQENQPSLQNGCVIPAGGTAAYTFYIPPAEVNITDDLLDAPLFTIRAVGTRVSE
jgi:hypothetical protein